MENYRIRKIDAHTWQLEDPFRTYLYLIEGTERAVLIDAGNGFSGLKEVIASLTDKPVSVVLTHGHFDHTGCAGLFESCSIHREDVSVLEEGFDRKAREHQVKRFAELFDVPLSKEEERYLIDVKKPEKLSFPGATDWSWAEGRWRLLRLRAIREAASASSTERISISLPEIRAATVRFWFTLITPAP